MQWGIIFANGGLASGADHAIGLAKAAEDAGFESLWTVEHVVVPAEHESAYPYSKSGRMPGGEDSWIPDPLIWLSFVAAATTRIRLATGILILPQRNPVILAKECATLDRLSNGRFELGIGIGWLKEEFEAIGVPWDRRVARTEEYAEALRVLWRDDEPTFAGEFTSFSRAKSYPKPIQTPIPIVVGGHTEAAARRAGRMGDGFFPAQGGLDELPHLLDVMRRAAIDADRDPDAIVVTAGGAFDAATAEKYAEIGVHRLVVPPLGATLEARVEFLGGFGAVIASTA